MWAFTTIRHVFSRIYVSLVQPNFQPNHKSSRTYFTVRFCARPVKTNYPRFFFINPTWASIDHKHLIQRWRSGAAHNRYSKMNCIRRICGRRFSFSTSWNTIPNVIIQRINNAKFAPTLCLFTRNITIHKNKTVIFGRNFVFWYFSYCVQQKYSLFPY